MAFEDVNIFEDENEEIVTSGDFTKQMPKTLPGSLFNTVAKPDDLDPLNLSALRVQRDAFADEFGMKAKTQEELDAMFPDTSYKSDKYLALAKAGLALMQPTMGGRIAPSIANAGTQLLNDVGAISAVEKKQRAQNRSSKLSYQQQQEANQLQLKAQAFGINQALLTQQYIKNYEERAKKSAAQWEAYNNAVNTSAEESLKFGIKKFESKPVTLRLLQDGQTVDRAGFLVNDQYYIPTKQKDPSNGEWIYEIVPDPTNVEVISTKNQDIDDVTKNMAIYNETYADYINVGKNIYSLRQIIRSIDPALGGDRTRVALTGYVKKQLQKYGEIASDFTKDFFAEEYTDRVTQERKGGTGKTVWLSDLSDIVNMADEGSVPDYMKKDFAMIDQLLDSLEADGMAFIDRSKTGDINKYFEATPGSGRTVEQEKNLIFGKLKFDTKIPENEARAQAIIYALARARKSSGRLNLDDIQRAAETLNIYNDSSTAILTKLRVVEEDLMTMHQIQADLLTRNFPSDAARLQKERDGTLDYSDDFFNIMYGNAMTPIAQTFVVIPKPEGGYDLQPVTEQ